MQVIWETQLAKPISQIHRSKVPSLLCRSMTALWQSIAGSGSVSLKWLNQEVLPHMVRPDVQHRELFFMANSSTKIKHSHTHIHTQREADCQPVSMSVLAGENAVCVFDGWKYHAERERERERACIYLQMLDTSVLTKQVMWRPRRWRSLGYIAVFSVFSCTNSAVWTGDQISRPITY